jgi:putative transposase
VSKDAKLSVRRQCQLLDISRSLLNYVPKGESEENLGIMRIMDELHLKDATAGSRRMRDYLRRKGWPKMSRTRAKRLMRLMGLQAVYPKRKTSIPSKEHKIYPYLLRGITVE